VIFFTIAAAILTLVYLYIGHRVISPAKLEKPYRRATWCALLASPVLLPLSYYLRITHPDTLIGDCAAWAGYISLGFLSLVLLLLLSRDILWTAVVLVTWPFTRGRKRRREEEGTFDGGRRQFLVRSANIGILGASGVMTAVGLYQARRRPRIVPVYVSIPNLPDGLEGFSITQFSDLHVGSTIKRGWVQMVVEQINSIGADVIVFTGDLADGPVPGLENEVSPLKELEAPHGSFFVTGNHEYYSGVEKWVEEVDKLGFTVLINEHRVLETAGARIVMAGVTDFSAGRMLASHRSDPEAALAGAPAGAVKVLLAHQPRTVAQASKTGCHLQLSGHTHGGQTIFWSWMVAMSQPYIRDLNWYEQGNEGTWVYVNSGTGYWGPPTRFGVPSEITVLTLTSQV